MSERKRPERKRQVAQWEEAMRRAEAEAMSAGKHEEGHGVGHAHPCPATCRHGRTSGECALCRYGLADYPTAPPSSNPGKRLARVELSLSVLDHLLRLPPGARVVRTQPSDDFRDTVQLLLEGDRFDEVSDGGAIPLYVLTWREPEQPVAEFEKVEP